MYNNYSPCIKNSPHGPPTYINQMLPLPEKGGDLPNTVSQNWANPPLYPGRGWGISLISSKAVPYKKIKRFLTKSKGCKDFQVCHFSNHFEQSPCYCKMGQRQRADLSVFGCIKLFTRRNITINWTLVIVNG